MIWLHAGLNGQDNAIGFNLKYNGYFGLGSELRYERNLKEKWIVGGSVSTNFKSYVSLTGGFKYRIVHLGKFSFLSGLDYNLSYAKSAGESTGETYRFIEIPLDIRVRLSDNYSFLLGAALISPLHSYSLKDYPLNNLRLGVIGKF